MNKPGFRSPQRDHNKFGIYNWFKNKYRITNENEIQSFINFFCESKNFKNGRASKKFNFCANRFNEFSVFAGNYIKAIEEIYKKLLD